MRSPEELLADPEVCKKLALAVTLLSEKDFPEEAALLAAMVSDPRAPKLWQHMELCLKNGWC